MAKITVTKKPVDLEEDNQSKSVTPALAETEQTV
jgi:hypothetical protein